MKYSPAVRHRSPVRAPVLALFLTTVMSSGGSAQESLQDLFRTPAPPPAPVTIFVAREIVTMSPVEESGTAVAVHNGRIIDVGAREELLARFRESEGLVVDETFADKVLTPGLIDPHLHFWLFALVANAHFITPADWELPWGDVKGVVGKESYMQRLEALESSLEDPDELLFTWGYHEAGAQRAP